MQLQQLQGEGLVVMAAALVVLALLVGQLALDGAGRVSWQFVTSFPSRFADQAGILSAWIGTILVMLVTALVAVPLGVGAAIYLEEYAPKNRLTEMIEINIANLAGVPSIVYGLLALGFYALCPNFLAHGALATSDAAGALMLTLAPWFFWRHLGRRDAASGAVAGLCSGLALAAKFNGVLLAPIYAVLAALDAWGRAAPGARLGRFGRNFALCLGQAAAGVLVIWAFFNFRFAAQGTGVPPLDRFAWAWPEMLSGLGWKADFIQFALDWKLLPQAWLYGLTNVLAGEVARPAFFAGEYRLTGWWEFFPVLFLAKTPLAMLATAAQLAPFWAAELRQALEPAIRAAR